MRSPLGALSCSLAMSLACAGPDRAQTAAALAPAIGGLGVRGRGQERIVSDPRDGEHRSQVMVTGSIDVQALRRAIRDHSDEVRGCYERRLAGNQRLEGSLAIQWVIDSEGRGSLPRVARGDLPDEELARCIMSRIVTWEFPKPARGATVVVTYPWKFRQAAQAAGHEPEP